MGTDRPSVKCPICWACGVDKRTTNAFRDKHAFDHEVLGRGCLIIVCPRIRCSILMVLCSYYVIVGTGGVSSSQLAKVRPMPPDGTNGFLPLRLSSYMALSAVHCNMYCHGDYSVNVKGRSSLYEVKSMIPRVFDWF